MIEVRNITLSHVRALADLLPSPADEQAKQVIIWADGGCEGPRPKMEEAAREFFLQIEYFADGGYDHADLYLLEIMALID